MQLDTFAKIMNICNSLMNYRISVFGITVSIYEAIFYELVIIVVLGGVLYLFRDN